MRLSPANWNEIEAAAAKLGHTYAEEDAFYLLVDHHMNKLWEDEHRSSRRARIVIHHECPPIPDWKRFNYVAFVDGEEENHHYGYGPTPEAAVIAWEEIEEDYDL